MHSSPLPAINHRDHTQKFPVGEKGMYVQYAGRIDNVKGS